MYQFVLWNESSGTPHSLSTFLSLSFCLGNDVSCWVARGSDVTEKEGEAG